MPSGIASLPFSVPKATEPLASRWRANHTDAMQSPQESLRRDVGLRPVTEENWRQLAGLEVTEDQKNFVAEPTYYLCLCHYGRLWQPLAIYAATKVVGMLIWALDPEDGSCWLGGILVDRRSQRQGIASAAVTTAIRTLSRQTGCRQFALSYQPENVAARRLYASLGFSETDQREGEEVVARLDLDESQTRP
jgi:diamine N-acetyltransferase